MLYNHFCFAQKHILRQITFSDSTHDGYPYWSPDGSHIIYSSGSRSSCTTMKISEKGGTPIPMTDYFSQHAQWSPNGSYLAFDGEFGTRVFIASLDGGTPIRVVPENIPIEKSGLPCWSPDSRRIAFHSKGEIWAVTLPTGEYKKIFYLEGKLLIPFCWSHDGNNIYASALDTVTQKYDIWKIPVNEGEARQITFLEGRQTKPSISPNDSLIVFTSDHGGNADLWVMSSTGGDPVQLTFYSGDDSNPGYDLEASWSPDGKKIAFSSTRSGYWAIWIMEPDIQVIKEKLNIE